MWRRRRWRIIIGQAQFMNEMNARAQAWGMTDTYFADPSGISAANESTAHDLLTLAQHVYNDYPRNPRPHRHSRDDDHRIEFRKKDRRAEHQHFCRHAGLCRRQRRAIPQAGGNLLSIFNYDGTPVLITCLARRHCRFKTLRHSTLGLKQIINKCSCNPCSLARRCGSRS